MKKKNKTKNDDPKQFEGVFLKKIILDNFKGYGQNTELELSKGINLIYGKNSAGKSSIIQAIRLIRQSLLIQNQPVPLNLIPPIHVNITGKLQFPEGFNAILFSKDKNRELKLGTEIGYKHKGSKHNFSTTLVHGFKSFNEKDMFPNFSSINLQRHNGDFKSPENVTDIKLILGKKNWIREKDKMSKFLTKLANESSPFLRTRGVNRIGWRFNESTKAELVKENFFYEKVKIDKVKIKMIRETYEEIMKDPKKNVKIIIDFLTSLDKKNSKDDVLKNEFKKSLIDQKNLIKLKQFFVSEKYLNRDYFIQFMENDIINKADVFRFLDQVVDRKPYDLLFKEKKREWIPSFNSPEIYFINAIEIALRSKERFYFPETFQFHKVYNSYLENHRSKLEDLVVIPGLRQLPERYHKKDLNTSFVGETGENIGRLLAEPKVSKIVNDWFKVLEIPYEIKSQLKDNYYYVTMRPYGKNYWLSYRDVGLGYSLSLGFIITALVEHDKVIVVEEPEVHLHPKLQGDIMDLLLYSAKERNNQFIIETHSENMLLRAQKCIRKGNTQISPDKKLIKIYSEDLSISNVFRDETSSSIQKIEIDKHGEFRTHWKDGFFSERLDDLF